MRIKALSPNNMIGRHLTTQNRVMPPKMPKKDKGHHKMTVTHNAKDKQAKLFFLKAARHVPQELSSIIMKQVQQQSRS
jgi:hypothetical protein